MFALILVLIGTVILVSIVAMAAAVTVVVVTVALLTRQRLVQIARQHKNIDQVSLRISENLRRGNFSVVRVGLLTKRGRETSKIEIRAEQVEDDIKVGDVLTV